MSSHYKSGFTIVELIIVISVIGILAAITVVAYNGVQARASDAKIKSAIDQIDDAIQLYTFDNGNVIKGGSGSTVVAGANGCSNGSQGWFGGGAYTCTAEDTLVSANLLPAGLTKGLPVNNQISSTPIDGRLSIMLYLCGGTNKYALYWTLSSPSADDTNNFMSTLTTCGHTITTFRDSYGMRSGKVIVLQ